MANNRMWLKCECGETFYLAKYYPTITDGWWTNTHDPAFPDTPAGTVGETLEWFAKFQRFLEQHSHNAAHRMYCPCFTLEYEEPEEMT